MMWNKHIMSVCNKENSDNGMRKTVQIEQITPCVELMGKPFHHCRRQLRSLCQSDDEIFC
jgi:hypothetical protein